MLARVAYDTLPMQETGAPRKPAAPRAVNRRGCLATLVTGLIVLGLLGIGVYAATGPYRTLSKLRDSLSRSDATLLSECVDFPTLRQNLKLQLMARANNGVNAVVPSGILSQIVGGVAGSVINTTVDAFVTPAGMSRLLAGWTLAASPSPSAGEPTRNQLENAHGTFESANLFLLTVPSPAGDVMVELTRSGLDWRVTNVRIPATPR